MKTAAALRIPHTRFEPPRARGFSLIELLVAMAILALVSAMAWAGLSGVTRARQQLATQQDHFAAVQRSVDFLARDLRTAIDRPVRVGPAQQQPALLGTPRRIAFTRLGIASQLRSADSALQRVAWFVDDEALVRARYPVLDRLGERGLQQRHMSTRLLDLQLRYMDARGAWHDNWPSERDADGVHAGLPRAVEFRLRFKDLGRVRRVVELASAKPVPPQGERP